MKKRTLFVTGGGTAGHVYPALAILEELVQETLNLEIFWLGRRGSFEEDLVIKSPLGNRITFLPIKAGKLRRYFSFSNFTDPFKIIIGFFQSLYLINKYKPILIFSKGGFVTVPVLIAGWFSRIPIISHESDLNPGLATKINSHFSRQILISFEKTKSYFNNQRKIRVVGNPIRPDILKTTSESCTNWRDSLGIPKEVPLIFVIGGSLGAKQINDLIHDAKANLTQKFFILHQTGKSIPPSRSENYLSLPFLEVKDMAHALSLADLIISRSGAGLLSELTALGKATILIPFQIGSRGDQIKNALYLEEKEASVVLKDNITPSQLSLLAEDLLTQPEKREKLSLNARKLAYPESAKECARIIHKEFL